MLERIVVNLGEEEARDIIQTEGILELTCHFCNRRFTFADIDLDWLFKKGRFSAENNVENIAGDDAGLSTGEVTD